MLVGDRGRVIPFRHFKGIALGVCCVSFLLLVAFITMSLLYINQGQKLASLDSELKNARIQSSKLRDEKDLYLTKLMLTQKQETAVVEKSNPVKPSKPAPHQPEKTKPKKEIVSPPKTREAPAKPKAPAPKIQWKADIRRFFVSYDPKREVLKAQFRIYNTSKPKKRLSGRSVVVFKVLDDPPVKWMPVPRVELTGGEPKGTRGQKFRVKNYLTMKFRAYRQPPPIAFNTATVYVFTEKGRMLTSKDFAFKIETPQPPPPKKEPAPSPPALEKERSVTTPIPSTDIPVVKPSEEPVPLPPGGQMDSGTVAPAPGPGAGQSPDASPPAAAPPPPQPEEEKPSDIVDKPPSSGPPAGASGIPGQTETAPETE